MTAIVLLAALAQAPAAEPEVFVDRGETYVRMGFDRGLTKGVTLEIVGADRKLIGTAVVMEVWDGLARVNLDTASTGFKGARYARQRGAVAPPPAGPPPPAPTTKGAGGQRTLSAKVQISGGAFEVRRVMVTNQDAYDWHGCKVILADGRVYSGLDMRANSDDGIMLFKFESGELRDPQNLVTVRCREGEAHVAVAP